LRGEPDSVKRTIVYYSSTVIVASPLLFLAAVLRHHPVWAFVVVLGGALCVFLVLSRVIDKTYERLAGEDDESQ
jgi:hypothetical protein